MIKKQKKTINDIAKVQAENTQAFKLGKGVYKDKDKFEYDENTKTGVGWLFVHSEGKVLALLEHTNKKQQATCIHEIEECSSEQACLDEIKKLGLIYNPPKE